MEKDDIEGFIQNSSFDMLKGKVDCKIIQALNSMGFVKPTQIQAKALPFLLQGKDVIGAAKTGSGKTLAFLIPVLDLLLKIGFNKKNETGCIILSPTRELALQTFEVLNEMLLKIELTSILIVGGENKTRESKVLKGGVNIIVGTPGRLLDHLSNTENFKFNNLKCLVVDEADKLLEAGFEKHITGIIKKLPRQRQTVLFSATIDDKINNLARLAMRSNPTLVAVKDKQTATVTCLKQGYYICAIENKISWLFKMLKKMKHQKVMVFFSSCKLVDFFYEFFKNHCEATVTSIHGKQSQSKRKAAYHSFVQCKAGALFCTDLAARGLDIPAVDWIIQYDPPPNPKEYIHRVGRTARGECKTGNAVILLRSEEKAFVKLLEKEHVYLEKYTYDDIPNDVQIMLEELVQNNGVFKTLARKAFFSYLRSYKTHNLKTIFNINTLNIKSVGKAFGHLETQNINLKTV